MTTNGTECIYFPGLLFSNGFRLLMERIAREAYATDSMNQAVLNWSTVALNIKIRMAIQH